MELTKEKYQLKLNEMEELKHTNDGLINDIVNSNTTIEQQTVQISCQEQQIVEKSKLMEEEQQKHKQNQIKSRHEFFITSANNIVKSKNLEKLLFLHKFTFDVGETHK